MTESAETIFNAYRQAVDARAYNGEDIPAWPELPEHVRAAWRAAYGAAIQHWIDNDYRAMCENRDNAHTLLALLKVGHDKGDDSHEVVRRAMMGFITGPLSRTEQ